MAYDKAANKLVRAITSLMSASPFISSVYMQCRHEIIDDLPGRACTDGTSIMFQRQFLEEITVEEIAGVLMHECYHIVFMHALRMEGRDHEKWNIAADYVINNMIDNMHNNSIKLPENKCMDHKYDNMTTEEVYALLPASASLPKGMKDLIENGDTGADTEQNTQTENIINRIIVQAKMIEEQSGKHKSDIPASVLRDLNKLLNPVLDWKQLLARFVDDTLKDTYSWSKRNRRYPDVYLPALDGKSIPCLTFAIDTSGSITKEDLQVILTEIKSIQDTFRPRAMKIIDCDASIHKVHEIDATTDILTLPFTGGGGTDFVPVLKYVKKHPTTALIYFTDLYGNFGSAKHVPNVPVLWICNSNSNAAPFGETIFIKNENYE